MAGFKPPKMPKAPKAPKVPGGGKPPKVDPGKLGGAAKKKFNVKKLLKILIPLLLVAVIATVLLLIFVFVPKPEDTVQAAIDAAFIEDEDSFKKLFTPESVEELESSWTGADIGAGQKRGSWSKMMLGLLTKEELKPVINEDATKLNEEEGKAQVTVMIDGSPRVISLVRVEDNEPPWLIDLLVPINIESAKVIAAADPEKLEETGEDAVAANDMWWKEEREGEEGGEGGGPLSCIGCSLVEQPQSSRGSGTTLMLVFAAGGLIALRRRRRGM